MAWEVSLHHEVEAWYLALCKNDPETADLIEDAIDQLTAEGCGRPVSGIVLHWWLGSVTAAKRAVELGCYFSVNAAMFRRSGALRHLPLGPAAH